uniref:Uncharacterized protein n=2 Tax=Brassica oleracea TaxID=3712 RepID=A0A0D3B8V8_BRAOL|nr:unnamed protein product [Brassica oleracea]
MRIIISGLYTFLISCRCGIVKGLPKPWQFQWRIFMRLLIFEDSSLFSSAVDFFQASFCFLLLSLLKRFRTNPFQNYTLDLTKI